MGISKWRQEQTYTTQPDDVARTIVTLWTKAGNFSFLAADLENGPILAPEHGFFIRRTSKLIVPKRATTDLRTPMIPLADKMNSIAGDARLLGWGSDGPPWFGGNPTDTPVLVQGMSTFPAGSLAMHPGAEHDVAVGWRSPVKGTVKVNASVAHAQGSVDGIGWWIARETKTDRKHLAYGVTTGTGSQAIPAGSEDRKALEAIQVTWWDMISLVIGPRATHAADSTIIELSITEVGGLSGHGTLHATLSARCTPAILAMTMAKATRTYGISTHRSQLCRPTPRNLPSR